MSPAPTHDLRRERLPNGVTLLVQRRRAVPGVAVVSHLRAGFLDEPDTLVGISHVVEHMLFKGTPSLGPGELAQRTKALGGSLNAYTSYDRTVYHVAGPSRHAAEFVALQADQVRNPVFDAGELARELGVIIQEARRKLDTPGAVTSETLHQLLFARHRLRRWRIGIDAELERFTRDDVAGYHATRYVPARAIVVLVGDVDEADALRLLRDAWGDWSRPEVPIADGPPETSAPSLAARRLGGDVELADLVMGWRAPGVLDATIPALDVAAAVLGQGRGARLAERLRDSGLVNAVGVSSYGVTDAGVFSIGAELEVRHVEAAIKVIGAEIDSLGRREVDPAELARAQSLLQARVGRHLERNESRAIALADAEALGDVTRVDRESAELAAVTPSALREAAKRWLDPAIVSAVAYLPQRDRARFDAALLDTAMRGAGESAIVPRSRPANLGAPASASAPHAVPTSHAGVHLLALPGCDILAARFGDIGQSSLAVYRTRATVEARSTAGLAALSLRTMLRGTRRLDASQLAFAMESLGGSISPSLGADLLGFGATVLSEHIGRAAQLLAEVLHEPRFDAATVATEQALLIGDARAVADDMARFPMQLALGVAFDDTGYGSPALGTPESVAAFDPEALQRWHRAMLDTGRTTFVVVGDREPVAMAAAVAAALDACGVPGPAPASAVRDARIEESAVIEPGMRVERRDRRQSALAMLFPGPSRRSPDRFAAETWSAIAGGLGGRLFESLRSKRSLAYSVMANSWQRRRAGGLLTYIATDPERLDEARAAMLEELEEFRNAPPSVEECARATAQLAAQAELSRQTAGALAGEIADAWLLGTGLAELDDPAGPYRAVTAGEVHAVAAAAFDPALRAEGVVVADARD